MRKSDKSAKGLTVRAIAGTYVVLLAFNCSKSYRTGLLGFAIEREDHTNGEVIWLRGLKKFALPGSDDGDEVSTRHHPIQKFHWGDYTAKASRSYTYTVHAMKGEPDNMSDHDSVKIAITCEDPDMVGGNGHAVHFNRSAAASQAFANRFPSLPKGDVEDPAARTWLSRGLEEAMVAFIDGAKQDEALHLFVYEFSKIELIEALARAKKRGVKLQILYDAIFKNGKGPSKDSKPLIKKYGLSGVARGRSGSGINISHNKFMVHADANGAPLAVWTGSTNFTDSGIYAQTNVGHAVRDKRLAASYLKWHQDIWQDPTLAAADSRDTAMQLTQVPAAPLSGTTLVLSPRTSTEAVTECAALVSAGKRMICFTAPFAMHDDLEAALATAPAQVFGLLNKDGVVGPELHKAANTQLAAAGALNLASVLESWQDGLLKKESMYHSGVYIHTKIILVDPLSDTPVVITGSANFSTNSSKNNDENQLFIAGETQVADVYLGEFMRMFDHYYFRDHVRSVTKKKKKTDPKAGYLDPTDGWTDRFFDGGEREALRLAFF